MPEPLLEIRDLVVEFTTPDGVLRAVDGVSWALYPEETLSIVGESGSGKSVSLLAVLGLLPKRVARVVGGQVLLEGRDLLGCSRRELRRIRGKVAAMVFQDPMTSLNPLYRVGWQLDEAQSLHDRGISRAAARRRSIELLELVGLPNAALRYRQYPHEFSGGMRQRAMIAVAMANDPKVLLADEPTTALDVTIQRQVVDVLRDVQRETHAAMVLVTHDLGLVAETADRVVVMYAGRVAETADVGTIFHGPRHPYTVGLLGSLPRLDVELAELETIPGQPPSLLQPPPGCAFHPRCALYRDAPVCREQQPPLVTIVDGHRSACHFHHDVPALARPLMETIASSKIGKER